MDGNERIENLEQALRRAPSDEGLFEALRRAYEAQDRRADLARLLETQAAVVRDPARGQMLLREAADLHRKAGDIEAEIRVLWRSQRLRPGEPTVEERLEELLTQGKRWPDLLRLYAMQEDRLSDSERDRRRRADLALRAGVLWEHHLFRSDQALACFRRACEADPRNTHAIQGARDIYARLGQFEGVLALLQLELEATADARRRAELLRDMGLLQWKRLGRLSAGAEALQRAAQMRPGDDSLAEALGELYSSPDYPDADGIARAAALFLRLGQRREAEGDLPSAMAYFRRALGADPKNQVAYERLEVGCQQQGLWEELERLYAQRIQVTASEREAAVLQMFRADLLQRRLGRSAEARACYEAALAAQGPAGEAASQLLGIYREAGEWPRVLGLLNARMELCTTLEARTALMMEMAGIYSEALQDLEGAAQLYHEVLRIQPDHARAQAAYLDYFRIKGEYKNLANLLRYLVQVGRQHGAPAMELCALLEELADLSDRRLGDLEGAVEAWQQLLELHPDVARSKEALGRLAARMQRWPQVIQTLENEAAQAATATQRLQALRRLAKAYFEWQVDPQRTLAILHEILSQSPQDDHALRMVVDICEREADSEGLARALEAQLGGIMTQVERASMLRRLGDLYADKLKLPQKALQCYRQLLDLAPSDRGLHDRILALLEEAEDSEALIRFLELRAQNSRSLAQRLEALVRLARVLERDLGDAGSAIRAWEQVRSLDPDHEEALTALCVHYRKSGRFRELLETLRARLQVMPPRPAGPRLAVLEEMAIVATEALDLPEEALFAHRERALLLPADRVSRDAAAQLLRRLGRFEGLAEALREQLEHTVDSEQRLDIALKLADVLDEKLGRGQDAARVLREAIAEDAPGDLDMHRRLRDLLVRLGDLPGACEVAERELLLAGGDPEERLRLASEVARLWQRSAEDPRRAVLANERVLELDPENPEALLALRHLLPQVGAFDRFVALAPAMLQAMDDGRLQLELMLDAARATEEHLHDPEGAFAWLRRAHEAFAAEEQPLALLQALCRRHGLFEALIALYTEARGHERSRAGRLENRIQVAALYETELGDARAAFSELAQGLDDDPEGTRLLPLLERLAPAARMLGSLYEVYGRLASQSEQLDQRRMLFERQLALAETHMARPDLALEAAVRLFEQDSDGSPALVDEVERLAELAGQWDAAIRVNLARLSSCDGSERLTILWHLARIHEERLGQPEAAFQDYLRAFAERPWEEMTVENLWRLARLLAGQPARVGTAAERGARSITEATKEVLLGDPGAMAGLGDEEGITLDLDEASLVDAEDLLAGASDATPGSGEEAMAGSDEEGETFELTAGQILEEGPILGARDPARGGGAPASRSRSLEVWAELADAYRGAPAADREQQISRLLQVAQVWQEGALDEARTFEVLIEAASLDLEHPAVESWLVALGQRLSRISDLEAAYREAMERASEVEELLRLQLKLASLLLDHGEEARGEQLLVDVLELRPDEARALGPLEDRLRTLGRWKELAALKGRLLRALEDRLPEDALAARLAELSDLYQHRLREPEQTLPYLSRLCALSPHDPALAERLADLQAELGDYAELVPTLEGLARGARSRGQRPELIAILHRLARVLKDELDLPEQAIAVNREILREAPDDAEALEDLTDLYEATRQQDELMQHLQLRLELVGDEDEEARPLLLGLSRLLETRGDVDGAVAALKQARGLRARDPELDQALTELYRRQHRPADAADMLRLRAEEARAEDPSGTLAPELLLQLADIQETLLHQPEAARATLEEAAGFWPRRAEVLQALCQHYLRNEAFLDYVATLERLIDAAPESIEVEPALLAAGRLAQQKLHDRVLAERLVRKALAHDPSSVAALDALLDLCLEDPAEQEQILRRRLQLTSEPRRRAEVLTALGELRHRRGAPAAECEALFRQALDLCDELPQTLDALAQLCLREGRPDEARALLEEGLTRLAASDDIGLLGYRLGEVYQTQGRLAEAYTFLLDAHRADPSDRLLRMAVGHNRFQLERWREALEHLEPLLHEPVPSDPEPQLVRALHAGGVSALELSRVELAGRFLDAALSQSPDDLPALGASVRVAQARGDLARARELMERQVRLMPGPVQRRALLRKLADTCMQQHDPDGAARAFEALLPLLHDDEAESLEVLPAALPVLRQAGRHAAAGHAARTLARFLVDPSARLGLLVGAAQDLREAGDLPAVRECLDLALALDATDARAGLLLAEILLGEGLPADAADRVRHQLGNGPPPLDPDARTRRARLLAVLGQAELEQGHPQEAIRALEQALALEDHLDLRCQLADLYGDDPDHAPAALQNHQRLVARGLLRPESLRILASTAARSRDLRRARILYQALQHNDQLDAAGEAFLAGYCPPPLDLENPFPGLLDEARLREQAALPETLPLREVFELLFTQCPSLFPGDAEGLGQAAHDRVTPLMPGATALVFSATCRALGLRSVHLYLSDGDTPQVRALVPPLVLLPRRLADTLTPPELFFVLGQLLDQTRPAHVLAAGLDPLAFSRLFLLVLRAFHPHHMRGRRDLTPEAMEAVSQFRRIVPFKAARRFGEIFRDLGETRFDSGLWRRAVLQTALRTGLLLCGDLKVAVDVTLRGSGLGGSSAPLPDDPRVADLVRFAVSEPYNDLRRQLEKK